MKNLAIIAFCFFSSFASAHDIEEVKVTVRRIEIVMQKLSEIHKQDQKTGDWHYVGEKEDTTKA